MYLTVSLILAGYDVTCPKPGPDVGIVYKGQRIWFEATSPDRGKDGSPDQVPKMKSVELGEDPVVLNAPDEKIVLRYLNSISTKFNEQYVSPGTELYTYVDADADSDLTMTMSERGIKAHTRKRSEAIVFYYKHALTSPPEQRPEEWRPIKDKRWIVSGDTVLAFRLLESKVLVNAERAGPPPLFPATQTQSDTPSTFISGATALLLSALLVLSRTAS